MKRLLFFLALLLPCKLWAATYYVDNTCANNGNGSTTTCASAGGNGPFNSIANMLAKGGGYAGDDVISLKCGQTYREAFSAPSSGTSGHPITLNSYGTCSASTKPILKGSDLFTSWSAYGGGQGSTWQATATSQVYNVWQDGVFRTKGSAAATLNDHEWFWASNVLYVRDDSGSSAPEGTIEGAVRTAAMVFFSSKNYWNVAGIKAMQACNNNDITNFGFRAYSSIGINFTDIESDESLGLSSNDSSTTVNRAKFQRSHYTSKSMVSLAGTGPVTISYAIIRKTDYYGINISGTLNVTLDNILIDATYSGTAIRNASSGTILLRNSMLPASDKTMGSDYTINSTAGTFTASNSMILPSNCATGVATSGVTDGGNNIWSRAMGWKAQSNQALVSAGMDDTQYAGIWDELNHMADEFSLSTHLAVFSGKADYSVANKNYIQNGINRGHWIANHTYSHADMALTTGFTLGCTKGTTCTVTISGGTLTTTVDGSGDLSKTLSNYKYPSGGLGTLCTELAGTSGYSCTGTVSNTTNTSAANLADVSSVNIRGTPVALLLDATRFYDYEVDTNKTQLQTDFTKAAGGAWSDDVLVYAYGSTVPSGLSLKLVAAGYLGARPTSGGTTWTSSGINAYSLGSTGGATTFGMLSYVFDNNNCNDSSGNSKNFTCSNVTYQSSVCPAILCGYQNYSASFNGTSSYAYRSDSNYNFTKGDGWITAWVYPSALNVKQTVVFQGSDDSNYQDFGISATGKVYYSLVTGGSEVVRAETATDLLTANAWQRITVSFYKGLYRIYVNNTLRATTASTAVPPAYTDKVYLGAAYNYGGATPKDYFGGYLHSIAIGKESYLRWLSYLNSMAAWGGLGPIYCHGDSFTTALWRVLFEAAVDNGTPLMSYRNALVTLRTSGTVSADTYTYTWVQTDAPDYHLTSGSAAINAGANLGYTVDYEGNSIVGAPDIGPYEYSGRTVGGLLLLGVK
jgi:hypothetical protein